MRLKLLQNKYISVTLCINEREGFMQTTIRKKHINPDIETI